MTAAKVDIAGDGVLGESWKVQGERRTLSRHLISRCLSNAEVSFA